MSDGSSGIEQQEKKGQFELVTQEQMPINGTTSGRGYDFPKELETIGFIFGEPIDDIFVETKLPNGWKKESTDHSMWSKLLDNEGRERARIFYKAAFYDRSAHVDWGSRFSVDTRMKNGQNPLDLVREDFSLYLERDDPEIVVVVDWDGKEIFRVDGTFRPSLHEKDSFERKAKKWLQDHYPQWENPLAYWND